MTGTIAFHASATKSGNPSGGDTVTVPATVIAGDVLVLADTALNGSGGAIPTNVIPSGFTQVTTSTQPAVRGTMSYKLAVGTEGGTTLTGMAGAVFAAKILTVFRPSIAATALTVGSVAEEGINGDPGGHVVAASGGTPPLIVFGRYSNADLFDQNISPRTFSPAADGELQPSLINSFYLKYKIYNSSPANVTVDMGDENAGTILQSFYLAVTIPPSEIDLDEAGLEFAGQAEALQISMPLSPAALSFAGHDLVLSDLRATPVVFDVDPAALAIAGQGLTAAVGMASLPGSMAFSGNWIGLPLVVTPAGLSLAGQDVPLRLLAPSRNRAPLKLPRPDQRLTGRLASYWKGVRN